MFGQSVQVILKVKTFTGLMKSVISWWKCLSYNKLERLSCTEMTHRNLLLGSSVKPAAVSVCVLLSSSPLQKTDRLLRHCSEARLLQDSSHLMQACIGRRLPGACLPQAVMLHLWWGLWKTGCGTSAPEQYHWSPISISWSVRFSHSDSGMVWDAFVWSCTMKIRQDQWGRPSSPDQRTN